VAFGLMKMRQAVAFIPSQTALASGGDNVRGVGMKVSVALSSEGVYL